MHNLFLNQFDLLIDALARLMYHPEN